MSSNCKHFPDADDHCLVCEQAQQKPKICYIRFEANPQNQYAFLCGALEPKVGGLVVILVGKDNVKKKLVECVGLGEDDPKATTTIFGIVQEQP